MTHAPFNSISRAHEQGVFRQITGTRFRVHKIAWWYRSEAACLPPRAQVANPMIRREITAGRGRDKSKDGMSAGNSGKNVTFERSRKNRSEACTRRLRRII